MKSNAATFRAPLVSLVPAMQKTGQQDICTECQQFIQSDMFYLIFYNFLISSVILLSDMVYLMSYNILISSVIRYCTLILTFHLLSS